MKLSESDIEIIWEGDATMQELDLKIRDLTTIKEEEVKSDNFIYRVYSNSIPPEFKFETNRNPGKLDGCKILTIKNGWFVSYDYQL